MSAYSPCRRCLLGIAVTAFALLVTPASAEDQFLATSVVRSTRINTGLCVLLGFEDTALATGLPREGSFLVHCLYSDGELVEEARKAIRSRGVYGKVSADQGSLRRLPYAENLVNLIVADNFAALMKEGRTAEELLRVLCPNGVAYLRDRAASEDTEQAWLPELRAQAIAAGSPEPEIVRDAGTWVKIVKPRPANLDDWTHSVHGPDGNAVAADEVVGPPRHLQWVEKPLWQRHHDTVPSVTAMVSSGGRLFYIHDEAPIGVTGLPDQWSLTARDAFNGLLLWKRRIPDWGWKAWGDRPVSRNQPLHIARRLVAVADRVYVTLGFNAPLTALDAASGEILMTYPGTDFTDEVLFHEGTLIVAVHEAPQKPGRARDNPPEKKNVLAINASTGRLLWKTGEFVGVSSRADVGERITHLMLAAGDEAVFFLEEDAVVALDLRTGEELWRAARLPKNNTVAYNVRFANQCTLLYHDGLVLLAQLDYNEKKWPWHKPIESSLLAISAKTGEPLWTHECGCWIRTGVFAVGGLIWVHDSKSFSLVGLEPSTGAVKRTFSIAKAFEQAHHHRCYRNKATTRYLLTARRGIEFIDWNSEEVSLHHWVRGTCVLGTLPCNGLVYAPPHPCVCYITAKLNGLLALAPKRSENPDSASTPRFEPGPAYDGVSAEESTSDCDEWPTYRHDSKRSGSTSSELPAELKLAWQTEIGGKPSSPVISGGRILVASVDAHRVDAFDAGNGKPLWSFTAGGRVDTPPTVYRGLALFGSADGCVYCLRASDGRLAWCRRASREDRRLIAFGQLESAWPVHGSVLVEDGVAYFAAGRSSFLDGGISICAVDPQTGELLQEKHIYSPEPETDEMVPCRFPYDMPADQPGALADVLVSDGTFIYMRHVRLDPQDLLRPVPKTTATVGTPQQRRGEHPGLGPQLISNAGLLDDSWFNQTYWTVGQKSHSNLLVFNDELTCGVRAFAGTARHSRSIFAPAKKGYVLFANENKGNKQRWAVWVPVRIVAMVLAGDILFAAGPPDVVDPDDPWAAFQGRKGGQLRAISTADGTTLGKHQLPAPPVLDGMAAAKGRLYLSTTDGRVLCFGAG
jgi:outer membrane protein assembly factor BamB